MVKNPPANAEEAGSILGQEDPQEKEMKSQEQREKNKGVESQPVT